MGLTKQYLRYVPGPVLGLVGGQKSNVVFLDIKGVKGKYSAVGACENVLVWDLRTGEKVQDQCVHLTMMTHFTVYPSCVIKWNCPSVLAECINNLTRRQNCTERIRSSLMIFNISHVFPLHCTFDMWTGKLSFIFILMPEWMMTLPVYSSKSVTKNNWHTCNHISRLKMC